MNRVTHRHDRSIRQGRFNDGIGYVADINLAMPQPEPLRSAAPPLVIGGELKIEELA
jgi:hypothetical protein